MSLGEREIIMLKLINILLEKNRIYLKLDMEKNTQLGGEDVVHVAQKFWHIFHQQLFLYVIANVCV